MLKRLIKTKHFWYLIVLPILLTCLFFFGLYKAVKYVEARDHAIFTDGYEIGRYDQLVEDDYNNAGACFNLSSNKALNILLRQYFKDCNTARTMYAIAQAESAGKQFAIGQNDNGTLDGGWLQVNSVHRRKGETMVQFINRMHILEENIKEAKNVLDTEGFTAWTTYKSGKYLQFL